MIKSRSGMKILFLTRRFYPLIGGVEKHCLEVGKRLVKKGYEITVVTEEQEGSEGEEGKEGIRIYRIPITMSEKLKKFQIWLWLLKNRRVIEEADIVHCHDVFFWYLPFRFLYPNKKVFTTFHGWEGVYPPTLKAKLIRKLAEKLCFGNICVGDYLKKWYGTKADYITYGGIEIDEPVKKVAKDVNSKLRIIFIGRLERDTGLEIYLESLEILRKKYIDFEIIFLGDGRLKEKAKKLGTVLGFVTGIRSYFSKFNVVFTSGYLSMLESLVSIRPDFAVYENSLKKDYLKMSPFAKWIVIESDPERLAQKVIDYKNGKLKIDTEGAYNWAKTQTWEKVTDLYLKLWGLR